MYLKRIELNGFKSFAKKTVFEFPAPKDGKFVITSIVGPNGSGKSNVSDAIRWVLGEQSLKQLRGKKSHDIIFSGSNLRGQLGMASVSLVFENKDHKIPVDYDEVIISRKLYRSGENEYLINGKKVRLIDFQILLAKAQFGNNSYGIIGQGVIDRFLFQTPAERKMFFDEASGIKEFQIRRHQASLRLKRTTENINQAELLLTEVSPRLRSLERQVKKLEKRQSLEIKLKEAQNSYYGSLWGKNKKKIDELRVRLDCVNKEYKILENSLVMVQNDLAELAREQSRTTNFDSLQNEYQKLFREKSELEQDRSVLSGRLQVEYGKAGEQQIGWLRTKIDQLKIQQNEYKISVEKLENSVNKTVADFNEKQKDVEKKEEEIKLLQEKISKSAGNQNNSYGHKYGSPAVLNILNNKDSFGKVYGAVSNLAEADLKYALALDIAAGGNLSSVVVESDITAKKCIEHLRSERLGTATFLPLNKINPRRIYEDQYDYLDYDGVHGFAVELVQFEDKYEDIFSYVFGSTLIVEDISAAKKVGIGKIRMVTLEGDVLDRGGSMRGGYRSRKGGMFSFLNQNSNITESGISYERLHQLLNKVQSNYLREKNTLSELNTQKQISENNLESLNKNKKDNSRELASLEQELLMNTSGSSDYGDIVEGIQSQKDEYDRKLIELEETLSVARNKIERFNQDEEDKKKKIFYLQDEMQKKQSELNTLASNKNNFDVEMARRETKQEDLEHEIKVETNEDIHTILKRGVEYISSDEFEGFQDKIQKIKYNLGLIGGIDESVIQEYEEVSEKYGHLSGKLKDLKNAVNDLNRLITELDILMKQKRKKVFTHIKKEFSRYFKLLFNGGGAELIEIYGREKDNELDEEASENKGKRVLQGIEITACPPGKKIKHIESLSGGERTMTSIALICAILRANPSPFVVLDEVEAALDESNSIRFTEILEDLASRAQCILITHNRATMNASDLLYGVTMGGDGVSSLVSVNLENHAKT
ncbi:MAG: chromosome segregation protein SMC [Candidatus Magasanikbacteria bacterium]|nr:chromosome segregation protein SMC [Candidatus Magasanikbacteria bacterium]